MLVVLFGGEESDNFGIQISACSLVGSVYLEPWLPAGCSLDRGVHRLLCEADRSRAQTASAASIRIPEHLG